MAANFGRFKGEVIALWLADGRNMQLTQRFAYLDPRGKEWVAPIRSIVNGASIPGSLWSVVGGPYEGQYRKASVVHDVACEVMSETWESVHLMFYEACRCGGVTEARAKMMYYAVYNFGPRWQLSPTAAGDHMAVRAFGAGPGGFATQPVAIDPQDLRQVMEYIHEENPSLAELRQLTPQEAQASSLSRAKVKPPRKSAKRRPKTK